MSYVQVDQGLVTHRKTLRLARLLGESRYAVVGRLVALWSWCLDSALTGELRDVDADILADVMGWDASCGSGGSGGKPADLFEALITAGFLDLDDHGRLRLHNWDLRMGPLIKRRADQAAASARYRESQRSQRVLPAYQPDVDEGNGDGHGGHGGHGGDGTRAALPRMTSTSRHA